MRANLEFATRESGPLALDLYLPSASPEGRPLVLVFPGPIAEGGARSRSTPQASAVGASFSEAGLAAAVIDYREEGASADVREALGWLRARAPEWGLDPARCGAHAFGEGVQAALDLAHEQRLDLRCVSATGGAAVVIEGLRADLPLLVVRGARESDEVWHSARELVHQSVLAGAPVTLVHPGEEGLVPAISARWHADRLAPLPRSPEEVSDPHRALEVGRVVSESGDPTKALPWLERALELGFPGAHELPLDFGFARVRASREFRAFVEEHAKEPAIRMSGEGEPGRPVTIRGRLVASDGETAVPGARLFLWQTDWTGVYSESGADTEARLFGALRTDGQGRFTVRTLQPRGYPKTLIPAHIHVRVSAPGAASRSLEILFADDPRLTPYARRRAARYGWPVAELRQDPGWVADVILRLPGEVRRER